MVFVSKNSIKDIKLNLTLPAYPSIFSIFLILKYQDILVNSSKKYDILMVKDAINLLMSIYSDGEIEPTRYSIIYPFIFNKSNPWEIGESSDQYVPRVANNLRSTIKWRGIVDFDERTNGGPFIRFTHDYVENIAKECKIERKSDRCDIRLLAAWTLREQDLGYFTNEFDFTNAIVSIFKAIFHINQVEERELFHHDGPIIKYAQEKTPMSEVRSWLPSAKEFNNGNLKKSFFISQQDLKAIAYMTSANLTWMEVDTLLKKHKQLILYGPPGTSKTYLTKELSRNIFPNTTTFLQFHPSYGYEEFIGGLRPTEKINPPFEPKSGLLVNLVNEAKKKKDEAFLLVLDEINRGNISKIFGEVISCLDRDALPVTLAYDASLKLELPSNLYIVGTMNSTDRSIALVDYALRRRFYFIHMFPDPSVLSSITDDSNLSISLVQLFEKINKRISENPSLGKEFQLGHTYFMPDYLKSNGKFIWSFDDLNSVFNNSILPLIEEYCYGNQTLLKSILGNELINRFVGSNFEQALRSYLAS